MTLGERIQGANKKLNEMFGTKYKGAMMRFKHTFMYKSWEVKRTYQDIYEAISMQ